MCLFRTSSSRRPTTEGEIPLPPRKTLAQIEEEQRLKQHQQRPLNHQKVVRPPPAPCPCGGTVTHMPSRPYVNATHVTVTPSGATNEQQQPQQAQPVAPIIPPQVVQYQHPGPLPMPGDFGGPSEPRQDREKQREWTPFRQITYSFPGRAYDTQV